MTRAILRRHGLAVKTRADGCGGDSMNNCVGTGQKQFTVMRRQRKSRRFQVVSGRAIVSHWSRGNETSLVQNLSQARAAVRLRVFQYFEHVSRNVSRTRRIVGRPASLRRLCVVQAGGSHGNSFRLWVLSPSVDELGSADRAN